MFFTVPEVRGRTYEDLDELFEARVPTRKFPQTKTKAQLEREREERKARRPESVLIDEYCMMSCRDCRESIRGGREVESG